MEIDPLKPRTRKKQLNVGFSEEDRTRIKACADKVNCSEADIVRLLVGRGMEDLEIELKIKRKRRSTP